MVETSRLVAQSAAGLGTLIAVLFTWRASRIAGGTFRNTIVGDLFREFRSPEMGLAPKTLHDFFERECKKKGKLMDSRYAARLKKDSSHLVEMHRNLHFQGRRVSQYYRHMAVLLDAKVIDARLIFSVLKNAPKDIVLAMMRVAKLCRRELAHRFRPRARSPVHRIAPLT